MVYAVPDAFNQPAPPKTANPGSVTAWIQDLRLHADQRAASEIYNRYFNQLVDKLRGRVNRQVTAISGSEDVVQYVLAEVLRGLKDGAFPGLQDRDSLWALMLHIGGMRVKQDFRHATAGKRDVRRTTPMEAQTADGELSAYDPAAAEPSPALLVELKDLIGKLADRLPDDKSRLMLICELQGLSTAETKQRTEEQLGVSIAERTIRTRRMAMRAQLKDILRQEAGAEVVTA